MGNYTLKIHDIRNETKDTITLCFKQPGLKKIKYLAGQYLTLIFRINGRRYLRPYSFSSAPGIDSFLEVTVKRVPNGIVSNYINDKIVLGDVVEVLQPMGDFIFPTASNFKTIFLWGVGSGVTPLFSLLKFILNEDSLRESNVHLIYGNHNIASSIFWDSLHVLQKENRDRFKITHFHTRSELQEDASLSIKGRIEPENVLADYIPQEILESLHYICGPADLKSNIKKILSTYNVDDSQILIEDFELAKDPKDFIDVETQKITLDFENNVFDIEVQKGKSILEAALDVDIELPYSCQTGNCDTCKGILKRGKSRMIGISKREDLLEEELLLCCSYPITEDVYIKI